MNRLNRTQNDKKTRRGLLANVVIEKTTPHDILEILRILKICFDIPSEEETLRQLLTTKANLNESLKVIDKRDGKIYGLLIFSEYGITEGSPLEFALPHGNKISEYLNGFSQVNGFAFVLDERIRGSKIDKQMLMYNKAYLDKFDFIWCAVDNELESHHYWERLGFTELVSIRQATFYIRNFSKKDMNDIFIIKALMTLDT